MSIEPWLDDLAKRYAEALFGGVPAGQLFGMPVLIRTNIPDDEIRVVNPYTGDETIIKVPPSHP